MKNKIFYTDGSVSGNPGPGAYGVTGWETKEDGIHLTYYKRVKYPLTTNNRMELEGILHVMRMAASDEKSGYVVYSDSAYCINMIKPGGWIETWAENGWKNSKKQDVENLDLVKEVYKYRNIIFSRFQIMKVKGHDTDFRNELTDAVATGNTNKITKIILKHNIKID